MPENIEPKPAVQPKLRIEEHPAFQKADLLRNKSLKLAHRFLFFLWATVAVVVVGGIFLHLAAIDPIAEELHISERIPALLGRLRLDPTNAVELDTAGKIISISLPDLRWYVGADQASALSAALKDRSVRINDLSDKVIGQAFLEFEVRFTSGPIGQLAAHITTNNFSKASSLFTEIIQGWSDDTRKKVGERAIFELNYGLQQLARLKQDQIDSLGSNLRPPRMHQIFWSSPEGALAEAVYWSFIGTLINLIVNISQARSRGTFRPDEVWISWSKLIYGPVLSFVLILAIYFGILNVGTEMRFWLLPLLGFLFGYNTRKLAMLIDRLSEKLLGAVADSTQNAWQAQAAEHAASLVRTEAVPSSIAEMKDQAHRVVNSAIVAATIKQQNEL